MREPRNHHQRLTLIALKAHGGSATARALSYETGLTPGEVAIALRRLGASRTQEWRGGSGLPDKRHAPIWSIQP